MRKTDRSSPTPLRLSAACATALLSAWCLLIAGAGVLPTVARAQTAEGVAPEQGRLTVIAEGRVTARPDLATLRFGVERMAESADDALAQMSVATGDLLGLLDDAGIAPEDRQTGALRLQPRWSHQDGRVSEVVGYVAVNEVTVRLRVLDRLGEVIDAAVRAGANRLHGLSFGLSEPETAQDGARQAAVAEGMRRAALYAEAAGVSLGRLVELTEIDAPGPGPGIMQADQASARAAGVPVAEGETVVAARVRLVYAIAP